MRDAHGILKIEIVICIVYYGHRGYRMSGAAARTGKGRIINNKKDSRYIVIEDFHKMKKKHR